LNDDDDDDDEDDDDMDISVVVVDSEEEEEDEEDEKGELIALCLKALISCNKSLISSWSLSTFCFLLLWLPCLSKAAATCGDSACLKWLRVR